MQTEKRVLFPLGLAKGARFCNRVAEKKQLKRFINYNQHAVVISPRRYGKSSLIQKTLAEVKVPFITIDFLLSGNERFVSEAVISGVGKLLGQLLTKQKKIKQQLLNIFFDMNPQITLGVAGQQVSIKPARYNQKSMVDCLLRLDKVAQESDKRAVIAMDEFQQIASIKNNETLEASIRHAVERSENICYLFSGSNRHLLAQMFNDKSRPLYNLCRKIYLQRISVKDYYQHVQGAAESRWGNQLDDAIISKILALTHCHAYYTNLLCQLLWEQDQRPTMKSAVSLWQQYIGEQHQFLTEDLLSLSPNQRTLLRALAKQPTQAVYSAQFLASCQLSTASAKQALGVLIKKDFIFKAEDNIYQVVDPALDYYLSKGSS